MFRRNNGPLNAAMFYPKQKLGTVHSGAILLRWRYLKWRPEQLYLFFLVATLLGNSLALVCAMSKFKLNLPKMVEIYRIYTNDDLKPDMYKNERFRTAFKKQYELENIFYTI